MTGLKTHIRELVIEIWFWSMLDKWEEKWSIKKSVREVTGKAPPQGGKTLSVEAYPLREVPNGGYAHVPWSRGDSAAFANDFPRLREQPAQWY